VRASFSGLTEGIPYWYIDHIGISNDLFNGVRSPSFLL
jgi:hypothetical protein